GPPALRARHRQVGAGGVLRRGQGLRAQGLDPRDRGRAVREVRPLAREHRPEEAADERPRRRRALPRLAWVGRGPLRPGARARQAPVRLLRATLGQGPTGWHGTRLTGTPTRGAVQEAAPRSRLRAHPRSPRGSIRAPAPPG